MRRVRPLLVALFAAALPLRIFAQAAGQPTATAPPSGPPPLSEGTAEFSYVGTSGNSSTQSIGVGGEFTYRPSPWVIATKATYVRNTSSDVLKAESVDVGAKASRAIRPHVSAFGRYEFLHDRFAGIDQRHIAEAGLATQILDRAPHALTIDGSLGYAREKELVGPVLSNPTATVGALYHFKVNETVDASEDIHVNFSLSEGRDWRSANVAALSSKLNSVLALKVSNTIRYVHAPVFGFRNTDTITAIALVAKF